MVLHDFVVIAMFVLFVIFVRVESYGEFSECRVLSTPMISSRE